MRAAGGGKLTEGTLGASRKAQGKYLDFLDILLTAVVSGLSATWPCLSSTFSLTCGLVNNHAMPTLLI